MRPTHPRDDTYPLKHIVLHPAPENAIFQPCWGLAELIVHFKSGICSKSVNQE